MMKFRCLQFWMICLIWITCKCPGIAQGQPVNYYLPDIRYNPAIPEPKDFLGFNIGEWHLEPSQVHTYLKKLAEISDRIEYREYARSHEFRPLFILLISHPDHIRNAENIRKQHQEILYAPEKFNKLPEDLPAILYQGYTLHGNEPSGVNAAVLLAYYLAAAEGPEIENTLRNLFILFDPCLNPDGAHRFATWVNSHKHQNLVSDPADREFNEVWPGGRYNHYWSDMNRDWLPAVHPESKGRIELFQEWRPNVLTDHHEMGTNSTFFFQPGIPSGNNPSTPAQNFVLTEDLGLYHATALDSIGSRYYTKASFDDFYYGKGSTYPDAQGAVGILFEQASSRGHIQESVNGPLAFAFTIRNQVVTSLSTHKGIVAMKGKLLQYKRDFLKSAYQNLGKKADKSFVFTHEEDGLLADFLRLLSLHRIEVYRLDKSQRINGVEFPKERSFVVPVRQKQPILALTMFEHVTSFQDSSFYDVSGWTPAAAYNLRYAEYQSATSGKPYIFSLEDFTDFGLKSETDHPYGYMIDIRQQGVYAMIYALQKKGVSVQSIQAEMEMTDNTQQVYPAGSFFISSTQNRLGSHALKELIKELAVRHKVRVTATSTGNKTALITAGHPKVVATEMPKAAVFTGRGVAPQSAGEVWFHTDRKLQMEITKLEVERLGQLRLGSYNILVMPDGSYNFTEAEVNKIKEWLRGGNRLVCIGRAVHWAVSQKLINLQEKKGTPTEEALSAYEYEQMAARSSARVLGGSILNAETDLSNPLFYGYVRNTLPFMHSGTRFYDPTDNKYATPAKYAKDYLLSGYIPRHVNNLIGGASVVSVHNSGGGKVIALQANPLFRSYWLGGERLFNNILFLSAGLDNNSLQGE